MKGERPFKFFRSARLTSFGWCAESPPHDAYKNIEFPDLSVDDILCILADIGKSMSLPTHGLKIHIDVSGNYPSQLIDNVRRYVALLGDISG
jgi:hypothetical protein